MLTFTIVWTDRNAVDSNGVTRIDAESALMARDNFEEAHPRFRVVGVFLNMPTELLSTYRSETRYLGEVSFTCVSLASAR